MSGDESRNDSIVNPMANAIMTIAKMSGVPRISGRGPTPHNNPPISLAAE